MAGQDIVLLGAQPVFQPIVLRYPVLDGFRVETVQAAVSAAVINFVNRLSPGAALLLEDLAATIKSVPGVGAFLASAPFGLVSPSTSIAPPSKATTFRTSSALVTHG
jgi:uncharacterized phage protein gp47/JayE